MRIVQSFLTTAAVALCLLTSPTAARAQEQDGSTLEEIIVTSQRRAQSVQDIPIAVSAFTADELEARNIVEALDIVQHVPNLIGHNNVGIGTANTYFIRAVGNTESIATFDPPVGTYIDDIYISRQNANNFAFFDMERVEVLRGPQGTLFGRNTTGGAVRLLLKSRVKRYPALLKQVMVALMKYACVAASTCRHTQNYAPKSAPITSPTTASPKISIQATG